MMYLIVGVKNEVYKMDGILYMEDGTVYEGQGFGKIGTSAGELVFNTSMTGYQEILTDPSYAGQIINMTYPLIGNYGTNEMDKESQRVSAKGFIVKSISHNPSNYMSVETIDDMLKKMGVVGICGVDTRSITKKIRSSGDIKCVISNENLSIASLKEILYGIKTEYDWVSGVSTRERYHIQGEGHRVALVDFGVKADITENLRKRGCDITVFPYNTSYEEIMDINPSGVLLSNGPGDPKMVGSAIGMVRKVINKVPTFGICLGHQILSLALGGDTFKMKYGHRGGNHGVYDIEKNKAYITSQNHGYSVDTASLEKRGVIVTHINLNDNTVEGIRHKELPAFSVQFHPEGSPGPSDSAYLFDNFIASMGDGLKCQ